MILKKDIPLISGHGTSDARFFTNVGNDAIEFGPAGSGGHKNDEWVEIESILQYYQILKNFLLSVKD